ncbi:MAG: hypothetical protein AAGI90_03510 [Chlamydiota bacterium]
MGEHSSERSIAVPEERNTPINTFEKQAALVQKHVLEKLEQAFASLQESLSRDLQQKCTLIQNRHIRERYEARKEGVINNLKRQAKAVQQQAIEFLKTEVIVIEKKAIDALKKQAKAVEEKVIGILQTQAHSMRDEFFPSPQQLTQERASQGSNHQGQEDFTRHQAIQSSGKKQDSEFSKDALQKMLRGSFRRMDYGQFKAALLHIGNNSVIINTPYNSKHTPLQWFIDQVHKADKPAKGPKLEEWIQALIDGKADVNEQGVLRISPLRLAFARNRGYKGTLIRNGARMQIEEYLEVNIFGNSLDIRDGLTLLSDNRFKGCNKKDRYKLCSKFTNDFVHRVEKTSLFTFERTPKIDPKVVENIGAKSRENFPYQKIVAEIHERFPKELSGIFNLKDEKQNKTVTNRQIRQVFWRLNRLNSRKIIINPRSENVSDIYVNTLTAIYQDTVPTSTRIHDLYSIFPRVLLQFLPSLGSPSEYLDNLFRKLLDISINPIFLVWAKEFTTVAQTHLQSHPAKLLQVETRILQRVNFYLRKKKPRKLEDALLSLFIMNSIKKRPVLSSPLNAAPSSDPKKLQLMIQNGSLPHDPAVQFCDLSFTNITIQKSTFSSYTLNLILKYFSLIKNIPKVRTSLQQQEKAITSVHPLIFFLDFQEKHATITISTEMRSKIIDWIKNCFSTFVSRSKSIASHRFQEGFVKQNTYRMYYNPGQVSCLLLANSLHRDQPSNWLFPIWKDLPAKQKIHPDCQLFACELFKKAGELESYKAKIIQNMSKSRSIQAIDNLDRRWKTIGNTITDYLSFFGYSPLEEKFHPIQPECTGEYSPQHMLPHHYFFHPRLPLEAETLKGKASTPYFTTFENAYSTWQEENEEKNIDSQGEEPPPKRQKYSDFTSSSPLPKD